MALPPAFLDELRARVPLAPVVGRRVKLTRAGREWKGCCPFHNEKTPSFYVNDDKGFYHCFGCGAHGDVIRFLTEQEGLGFIDAVKQLAGEAGMTVPSDTPEARARGDEVDGLLALTARAADWFQMQLRGPAGAQARAYLDRRQVAPAQISDFGLGFSPDGRSGLKAALKDVADDRLVEAGLLGRSDTGETYDRFRGRLMFPIRDRRGRVVGFGGRALGDAQPKYLNSADGPLFDKGRLLYNLDRAGPVARKSGRLVIVEGYMDVIGAAGSGFTDLVAPLGTALTEAQLALAWRQADEPILCFDGDGAGQRAALRAAMRALPLLLPGKSLRIASLPPGIDPDDLVRRSGPAALEAVLAAALSLNEFLWRSETSDGEATTPERRAAVRQRLRAHADSIADTSVKSLYAADFATRFEALYLVRAERPPRRGFVPGSKFVPPLAGASPALRAGRRSANDAEAKALLVGLLMYPVLADRHSEALASLPLADQGHARLRDGILKILADKPGLETLALSHDLEHAGLKAFADAMIKGNRLRFSFTRTDRSDDATSREAMARDFGMMLDSLAARARVETALATATAVFSQSLADNDFQRQQALLVERMEIDAVMMRLAESLRDD